MDLKLFNTLTRSLVTLEPVEPGRVTMYTCGPTVYNFAHIGNFRTFLFEDLLRRYLESLELDVFQIMNLTDVDDRTINAASERGATLNEHTAEYITAFFEDCEYLRIRKASVYPRATEYVQQMIELVRAGRAPEELGREFEPTAQTIRNWVEQDDLDRGRRTGGLTTAEREELGQLRREVRRLRQEREILAKATAWFARETGSLHKKSSSS